MGGSGNRTAWLAWLESERRYGANTLAAYESDLDDYLGYAGGDAGSAPPDRRRFRGWLADMAGRGLARTTVARRVSALRSFYRFCGRTGRIDINDLSWLRAPRPPKSVPKPVSEEDARALLAAIFRRRGDDWAKQRDFALLMMLYGSGLRISEALDLTRRDVPLGDWLRITGKGGKIREVPMLPAIAEAVVAYVGSGPARSMAGQMRRSSSAPAVTPSAHGRRKGWWNHCGSNSAFRRMSHRMRFATPLPRIFLETEPIFVPFRNCLAMPACRRHSATPMWTRRICCAFIARLIPAPDRLACLQGGVATYEWRGRRRRARLLSPPRSGLDGHGRCGRYPLRTRRKPLPWRIHG